MECPPCYCDTQTGGNVAGKSTQQSAVSHQQKNIAASFPLMGADQQGVAANFANKHESKTKV
jgi:hypothetical protein